jgi:hypothetical protein
MNTPSPHTNRLTNNSAAYYRPSTRVRFTQTTAPFLDVPHRLPDTIDALL